jgi:hypothetical protein
MPGDLCKAPARRIWGPKGIEGLCSQGARIEIHPAGYPGPRGGQLVVVIIGAHPPGQVQLFQVVQADDALSLGFGFADRRKEHAGQIAMMAMTTSSSISVKANGLPSDGWHLPANGSTSCVHADIHV